MARTRRDDEQPTPPAEPKLAPLSRAMRSEWTVVLAASLLLSVACYFMWQAYGGRVLRHPTYLLTREQIHCTAVPSWIRHDIVDEVLRRSKIEMNLNDPQLTPTLFAAFKLSPWVSDVKFVGKEYPAKVNIELEYRKPVAWVHVWTSDLNGQQIPGVQPVDATGVWLPPEDFSQDDLGAYARIAVGETSPTGPAGALWGDKRVHDAARLAAALQQIWHDLELYQIEPTQEPLAAGENIEFDIVTRGRGILIHWGHAPGEEVLGEPTVENKIAYLGEAIHPHRVDAGGIGYHIIDLRRLPSNWSQTARRGEAPVRN